MYWRVLELWWWWNWWWSQYCFFFCLLLVILASTVFRYKRHACWPLTIHTTWWWWKRPVCWSGASCPWCPFGSLHCCHRHPFCRNDEQLYKQHEYQLDIPLLLLSLLLKLLLWSLKKIYKKCENSSYRWCIIWYINSALPCRQMGKAFAAAADSI